MKNSDERDIQTQPIDNESRRGFLRKAVYVPPLIATMSVLPRVAAAGSVKCDTGSGRQPASFLENKQTFQRTFQSRSQGSLIRRILFRIRSIFH